MPSLVQRRLFYDAFARHAIAVGGSTVIVAVGLIFFYLLYVVLPIFHPAALEEQARYPLQLDAARVIHTEMEELGESAVRVLDDGRIEFMRMSDGRVDDSLNLGLPEGVRITSVGAGLPASRALALGLSDGTARVLKLRFDLSYPDDRRTVTPAVEYPMGAEPISLDPSGRPLTRIALRVDEDRIGLAAVIDGAQLRFQAFDVVESLLGGRSVEAGHTAEQALDAPIRTLLLSPDMRSIFGVHKDSVSYFGLTDRDGLRLREKKTVVAPGEEVTAAIFLLEGISLLIGDSSGRIAQWFLVRDENNRYTLAKPRAFEGMGAPVTALLAEHRRKSFVAGDAAGGVGLYHATAHRTVLQQPTDAGAIRALAISPRSKVLAVEGDAGIRVFAVDNEHPEISFSSIWGEVWYESYPEPDYIWQSSSATSDFEPKFSLVPLTFGTFKAAFFALLVAVPLGIMAAIYTANFMGANMRRFVKPSIEIMEAMPTVILGFLAGLWLAPVLEANLPGIFSLLLLMPLGMLTVSWFWHRLPQRLKNRTEGWEAAILIPAILLVGFVALSLSKPLEATLFGGDIRLWLSGMGVDFDQRNAMVVGLAMGFAVIPTIFSISEDAIFSVPRHLINGSLALGATPWQTLARVVLPTASPGIFSAVMMGLGRAVGETMIVLMATGNTPVMDMSLFQGMRTLSANIAVEMPESEVDSTHYRVLFLAALVLFLFTFVFNTAAEIVRQRLRKKYGSL